MEITGLSDKGAQREENEDRFFYSFNHNRDLLALVCDGIGGADHGDQASQLAVDYIGLEFSRAPRFHRDYEVDGWIRQTLNHVNDMIFTRSVESGSSRGMGTTAVGVIITEIGTYIFNVGDSRIYAHYPDGLIQMSRDHSIIQELLRQKKISESEARDHEQRNMLTNALGIWRVFRIDVDKIASDYSRLLLCSDGLHGYVEHDLIEQTLNRDHSIQDKASELVALANEAGGWDNCSLILIEKKEPHEGNH